MHVDHAMAARNLSDATVYGGGRLKLTRRGRRVFGGAAALLLVSALTLVAAVSAPNAQASAESSTVSFGYIAVQPGASLWSIATQLDPNADPRDVIAEVVRLNQLSSSEVQSGQVLAVPLAYRDAAGVSASSPDLE